MQDETNENNSDLSSPFRGTGGLMPHIESLIFASDKPLTTPEITELLNAAFGFMDEKLAVEQVETAVEGIVEKYSSDFYPFEVRQSGGGWQFLTKKEFHKTVAQLNGEKFLKRLSTAALETLAIVAYKQPVTKGEMEAIRGVSSDYAVQKLLEKELIVITGRNEKLPGHPLVYATSKGFMDYFGINTPEDLPKIKEVLAEQLVQPTVINHTEFEKGDELAVADNGELVSADEELFNSNGSTDRDETKRGETATDDDSPTETLADEIVVEDYISDEIFAAEDEAIEAKEVEEELKADDLPDADQSSPDEDTTENDEAPPKP